MNRWKPNVTVATVIERTVTCPITFTPKQEYLLVHETRDGKNVYNQPAGHLDEGESLCAAAIRETLEETAWDITLESVVGVYRFVASNGTTYLRHAFSATADQYHPSKTLDDGIIEAVWLSYEQIVAKRDLMRSHMVIGVIDDYRQGHTYPLSLFHGDL